MSGNITRLNAIAAINSYEPIKQELNFAETPTRELFNANVFSTAVMKERLPKDVYKSLMATIEKGEPLDISVADVVANAMKDWAIEKGATHYAHVFYPLTGLTAEKHDSFLSPDGNGSALAEFSGYQLIQGEPDGSSFPTGGIRPTFEARGYTAWDVTSPAYILENPNGTTLCIPTAFVSWSGEALDKKTPVLRSNQAINAQAQRILKLFGDDDGSLVVSTAGPEQEYFLIDRNFYYARPDLLTAGRTLFGAPSPKGQEFDDHYFGAIPERVLGFMLECEAELFKLGVPVKTRHNEVAPGQFEVAPMYESANVATDHQHLLMITLKRVAPKYGMVCLTHEKPFAGINGSGKHVNYSLGSPTLGNLLEPGDTPHDNVRFLVFTAGVIRAVSKYASLLRSVIASAGNDHRLGANEAPPAIISVFLGKRLTEILNNIKEEKPTSAVDDFIIDLGLSQLPSIMRDNTDRNRTSPFAFTGAKFEFRAIGSAASVSFANTVLSAAVADSIDIIVQEIEEARSGEKDANQAVLKILRKHIIETEPIRFEGNNYSQEWEQEAARRKLPNIKRTGYALNALMDKKNVDLLMRQKIYNRTEIESRFKTRMEQYILALLIEAETFCNLASTHVIPAAIAYQSQLVETINGLKSMGKDIPAASYQCQRDILMNVTSAIDQLNKGIAEIRKKVAKGEEIGDLVKKGKFFSDNIFDLLEATRIPADQLETLLPDELWPLPKYSEMLFIM